MQLFLLPSIRYQPFDNLQVQGRFSAEKVYLQVAPAAGICN